MSQSRRVCRAAILAACSLFPGAFDRPAEAQAQTAPPSPSGVQLSGSWRARAYTWNWFGDDPAGEYGYPASIARVSLSRSKPRVAFQLELAIPILLNLPATAVEPPPAGQLGLGAAYFAANANSTGAAMLFLKQGFVRMQDLGGVQGQSLRIGRMEFNDGAEVVPDNASLAAIKRERISQRLLGAFGFTDVGRSIDGAAYALAFKRLNLTTIAGRPTQGVFDVNGWPELKINLFYGAVTKQLGNASSSAEWRAFALGYDDYRHLASKADNRPAAIRSGDTASIAIATFGGHYIAVTDTSAGPFDLLFWGAAQTGAWGTLTQRAGAFAAEAGWQPWAPHRLNLWIRGGYDYGSGDSAPLDQTHGTFFQVLPTPRIYARFPFFNLMNSADRFLELQVRPSPRVAIRGDVHGIRLADAADLWYSGGGAFQRGTFGYTGRPANGNSDLATLYDLSGDWTVNTHVTAGGYYALATSGGVPRAIYPSGGSARFGYGELSIRF